MQKLNKKQLRTLTIALALVIVAGIIAFALRNRNADSGSGDEGLLSFTTLANLSDTEEVKSLPEPGPDNLSENTTEQRPENGAEIAEQESGPGDSEEISGADEDSEAETSETAEAETTEETEAPTEKETAAPTEEETTAETTAEPTTEIATETPVPTTTAPPDGLIHENGISVAPDGEYTDKDHVALYIHAFGYLPSNYITKQEAEDLGWVPSKGNLWEVAPGKSIGGSHFGNYEKLLPTKKGRKYYECDIDYKGKSRGAKRIIYSNDGLIFYTSDHYESFEQLY